MKYDAEQRRKEYWRQRYRERVERERGRALPEWWFCPCNHQRQTNEDLKRLAELMRGRRYG